MRVLVTGGSGFLGSHVSDRLAELGHDVTVFDLVTTRSHRFIAGDLASLEDLTGACRGIEAVCHLAAVGDVTVAVRDPRLAAERNVCGTINVMEAGIRSGVARMIYGSTWEVYGEPRYAPLDEAHPTSPEHPYSITKLAGEQVALFYQRVHGLPVVSLRLGTAFGRRMRPTSVFCRFIAAAADGQPITIEGSGLQTRQFTHARDIANAFTLALTSTVSGEVFNIVAAETVSIRQLAEAVVARLPTEIVYKPPRAADVPVATVSSAKAERVLGWIPSVSFAAGLSDMLSQDT